MMADICTVRSLLAALHTCPRCGEVQPDDMALQLHIKEHDEPNWKLVEPTPEWGDLEDHGWMGTSERNNPTIRDDFPASFG